MVRALTIQADDAAMVNKSIGVTRDEPYRVIVSNKPDTALVMTIANGGGDDPLLEIPGVGSIDLPPVVIQALTEGRSYQYNIWQLEGPMVLFTGAIMIGASIAPTGADFATTFLSGFGSAGNVQAVVYLTRAEFGALATADADTLYIVED